MAQKRKRYFNTSGPNMPDEHYTLPRLDLIKSGMELVHNRRYFTIWAPRQTGKSTYFRALAVELIKNGYKVCHVNLENYRDVPIRSLFNYLLRKLKEDWGFKIESENFGDFQDAIENSNEDKKCVLIIDEIEGLNPDLFNQFLHSIRNLYHSRDSHCLKSVILVGVSNIVGIIQDNASPFNIADNLEVPYFTNEETCELLGMHEEETGQRFSDAVKQKVSEITANQPGLVNAFAYQLVNRFVDKDVIEYDDILTVEHWFLKKAIDKNIANVVNKAQQYRPFIESLLFTDRTIEFDIERPAIKFLHTQGIVTDDEKGNVKFWVPVYRKKLFSAFYPYLNGESDIIITDMDRRNYFLDENDHIDFDRLIEAYRDYVKRRGFRYFREKDEDGSYKHIKEAAIMYSFETFIQMLLREVEGKSYMEPHSGLGNCDLLINIGGRELVIEFKIYRSIMPYNKGKKQLAHYCKSVGQTEGIYLVFVEKGYEPREFPDGKITIDGVNLTLYHIWYDKEKDF